MVLDLYTFANFLPYPYTFGKNPYFSMVLDLYTFANFLPYPYTFSPGSVYQWSRIHIPFPPCPYTLIEASIQNKTKF
jgi:hypothetical protein